MAKYMVQCLKFIASISYVSIKQNLIVNHTQLQRRLTVRAAALHKKKTPATPPKLCMHQSIFMHAQVHADHR